LRITGWHEFIAQQRTLLLAFGILIVASEVFARADFSGRFILTYQDGKTGDAVQEAFVQHLEGTIRDRLFETTSLRLSLVLDNRKDLSSDLTNRRYRGHIDLLHRYYQFNATVMPKQKTTPLELDLSREMTENQLALRVFVPRLPQFRLGYSTNQNYVNGLFVGRSRNMRGDLMYVYKILTLGLNRWYTRQDNGAKQETHVAGGRIGLNKSFRNYLSIRSAYDHQQVQNEFVDRATQSTTNRVFTATLQTRQPSWVLASWSTALRRFYGGAGSTLSNKTDQYIGQLLFFPKRRLQLELSHNYNSQEQNGSGTLLNFATIQINTFSPPHPRWSASAQLSRRVELEAKGRAIPPNMFFVTGRGKVFDNVDARADMTISQRPSDVSGLGRYSAASRLELILRVRSKLYVQPRVEYYNISTRLTPFDNERMDYRVRLNYTVKTTLNLTGEWRRTIITTGTQQQNTSLIFNLNARLRNRSSLQLAYGINEIVDKSPVVDNITLQTGPENRATTLHGQWQMWLTERGSLAINYTQVDRNIGNDSSFLSLSYRQDF